MNFLKKLHVKLLSAIWNEKGQTLIEYGLLLVLIAVLVIIMVKGLGGTTNNSFSKVNSSLR